MYTCLLQPEHQLGELLHCQSGPRSVEDVVDIARNIRQILALLGPSGLCYNLVNTIQRGARPFSLSMALEEAFKAWENSNPSLPSSSEWRPVRTSSMALRQDIHSFNHQTISHSPAWTFLASRAKVTERHRLRTANTLHWNLLSTAQENVQRNDLHQRDRPNNSSLFPQCQREILVEDWY